VTGSIAQSARPLRPLLAALVAAATLVCTDAGGALAEPRSRTEPRNAKPASKPAAQGPSTAGEQQIVAATPWKKFCPKEVGSEAGVVCMTSAELQLGNGQLIRATLIERDGTERRILRFNLPRGAHWNLGVRVVVDQGRVFPAGSVRCPPSGCMADVETGAELLAGLRGGRTLTLQSVTATGQVLRFPISLANLPAVLDGPPGDQSTAEDAQRRKLEDELNRRAEDMRRTLQPVSTGAVPTPPAAGGNALQEQLEKRAEELRRKLQNQPAQPPDQVRR
jgi:invasion protein IalB